MDIVALKANTCFASLDPSGGCDPSQPGVLGFFLNDTRHLAQYQWTMDDLALIEQSASLCQIDQYWSRFSGHAQSVLIERQLVLAPDGFSDKLILSCEDMTAQTLRLDVTADADFRDVFELRGVARRIGWHAPDRETTQQGITWRYEAQDGVNAATNLTFENFTPGEAIVLEPGMRLEISVRAVFESDLAQPVPMSPEDVWTQHATDMRRKTAPALATSFGDIDALISTSAHGPFTAAGVPNYVVAFGRDSLISAWFLQHAAPSVARGTLRLLAHHQGQKHDPERQEAPGKIPHELRVGEMSRCGDVPFARYYGTNDATALFLILLRDVSTQPGGAALVGELADNAVAALGWIEAAQDADGLIRYEANQTGRGLLHTSWKDSDDSVSYSDGALAGGQIAVVEIQAYAAAALDAAADLAPLLGLDARATALRTAAATLRETIDRVFWMPQHRIHAIALDADNRLCDTATSNPGHLLWAGALSQDRAATLAERMMEPDLWSGWGLRTLSKSEARYQPLSYHNGSVWPHDTLIFAAGLRRYGLSDAARIVAQGIADLAQRQPGYHLPELFGGYGREGTVPPLGYADTCRPQAWAAAAMVWAVTEGVI